MTFSIKIAALIFLGGIFRAMEKDLGRVVNNIQVKFYEKANVHPLSVSFGTMRYSDND